MNKLGRKIKLTLFFNNHRGIKVLDYLRKKQFHINNIIISKKFLNPKIIIYLKKKKIKFYLIGGLNKKIIEQKLQNTDLGLVCGFPHIFKERQIKLPKYGILNCHAGKLPNYRGGSPLNWQLINGEKIFGISVIKMNKGIDTGNILLEKQFSLLKKYDINDLHKIANNYFPSLVYKSIKKVLANHKGKKQNKKFKKYHRQRNGKDSLINLKKIKIKNLQLMIRALADPYPNPYFLSGNRMVKIKKIKKIYKKFQSGKIIEKNNKIFIGCFDGSVELLKYKIINK